MKRMMYSIVGLMMAISLAAPAAVRAHDGLECEEAGGVWSQVWSKYVSGTCGSRSKTPAFMAPNVPQPESSGLYVALGDSVAAGLGLLQSGQPINNDAVCGISPEAYPVYVAGILQKPYVNAACSGATAGDLITKQRIDESPNIPAQLDTAYANGVPDVITITAGANDVRWDDFARKCYIAECGTRFDETAFRTLRATLRVKLEVALERIKQLSGDQVPTVAITGYYQPIAQECALRSRSLTSDEVTWFRQQVETLNQTINNSTDRHEFAEYVPVSFAGHELCSDDPWVQGLQDSAPFHPTSAGQRAIGEAVVTRIH